MFCEFLEAFVYLDPLGPSDAPELVRLRNKVLANLERLLSRFLCPVRDCATPIVFSLGGGLPMNLCSNCSASTRHGGIEPAIIPTVNSAVVHWSKVTRFPIECQSEY